MLHLLSTSLGLIDLKVVQELSSVRRWSWRCRTWRRSVFQSTSGALSCLAILWSPDFVFLWFWLHDLHKALRNSGSKVWKRICPKRILLHPSPLSKSHARFPTNLWLVEVFCHWSLLIGMSSSISSSQVWPLHQIEFAHFCLCGITIQGSVVRGVSLRDSLRSEKSLPHQSLSGKGASLHAQRLVDERESAHGGIQMLLLKIRKWDKKKSDRWRDTALKSDNDALVEIPNQLQRSNAGENSLPANQFDRNVASFVRRHNTAAAHYHSSEQAALSHQGRSWTMKLPVTWSSNNTWVLSLLSWKKSQWKPLNCCRKRSSKVPRSNDSSNIRIDGLSKPCPVFFFARQYTDRSRPSRSDETVPHARKEISTVPLRSHARKSLSGCFQSYFTPEIAHHQVLRPFLQRPTKRGSHGKLLQCGHTCDIATPPCPPLARWCVASNLCFSSWLLDDAQLCCFIHCHLLESFLYSVKGPFLDFHFLPESVFLPTLHFSGRESPASSFCACSHCHYSI